MIICPPSSNVFSPLRVGDVEIERVDVFKLLGVYIKRSLKWDEHVRSICNKAASRIRFLKRLKRSSVVLMIYFISTPPWLDQFLNMHALFGRVVNIVTVLKQSKSVSLELFWYPPDYLEFCTAHSYFTLHQRRDLLCRQFFFQSVLDKSNCLNYLLPELRSDGFKDRLRHPPVFKLPRVRTTRFKSSFINCAVDHYVWSRLILKCLIIVSCRCFNERVNVFILYYLHLWVFCNFTFPCVFCNPALGLQYYQ